jgi:dihydroflavonol-4-reductase
MLAAITGASGLLGGNLAIELLKQGHRVRATRRGQSKVAHLEPFDIEWVSAELGSADDLARAFQGADVVFHCAAQVTIVRRVSESIRATNVEGTRNVIEAVRRAGVARLVHCSTVGAVGLSEDGRPCDETVSWNFDRLGMDDAYVTTKHWAEDEVRQAVQGGLDAVIVNPTYMLGPYDAKPSSGKMIVTIARRRVPGYTGGANNFVDVRDVARGMILAWQKGKRGERYILGGENLPYKEAFARIARVAGVQPPRLSLPRLLATPIGWAGDLAEKLTGKEPSINSVTVDWGYCTRFQFSSDKARRELGYTTGPLEPAIADALTWFRQQRMV